MFKDNFLAIIILSVFLIFNLVNMSNYGMSWDEAAQHHLGRANIDYLTSKTENIELLRDDLIFYGPFFEIINQHFGQSLINSFNIDYVDAFHILIIITAFIGFFFFFLLIKRIFNKPIAYYSLFLFLFFPRFIAHFHYNSKDVPVAVFSIITIYYLYLTFKEKKLIHVLMAGIFLGLGINTRMDTLLILPIFFLPYLISKIKNYRLKDFKKDIFLFLIFIITSIITIFITWPALWHKPLLFFNSISFFMNHGWPGQVLYLGQIYSGTELPWHYTPIYLLITTPLIILIFLAVGAYFISKNFKNKILELSLIISWLLIPILLSIKSGIVRYDGIRHYLIITPAIATIAGVGIYYLIIKINKKFPKKYKNIIIALFLIVGASLLSEVIIVHPFEGSYFNRGLRLIIPEHIENYFEIEYWGVTYNQGIKWLNKNAIPNSMICLPFAEHLVQFYPVRSDLMFTCNQESNYLMFFTRKTYIPNDLNNFFNYSELEPIFKITKYNSDLLYIYKLK